jgi:hypothetical protein
VPQPARALCGAKFDLIRFVRSVCRICYGSCRRTPSFVLDLVDAGLLEHGARSVQLTFQGLLRITPAQRQQSAGPS